MVVAPEYQGRGIGKAVAEKLLAYAQSRLPPGGRTSVQLIAAEGKEGFYTKSWAFGKCRAGAAALRCGVCCTDTRRNKEKALSRGLLAEARAKAVSSVEQLFAAALPDTYTVTVQ